MNRPSGGKDDDGIGGVCHGGAPKGINEFELRSSYDALQKMQLIHSMKSSGLPHEKIS